MLIATPNFLMLNTPSMMMGTPFIDVRGVTLPSDSSGLEVRVAVTLESAAYSVACLMVADDLAALLRILHNREHSGAYFNSQSAKDSALVVYGDPKNPATAYRVELVKLNESTPERATVRITVVTSQIGDCDMSAVLHYYGSRLEKHRARMHD